MKRPLSYLPRLVLCLALLPLAPAPADDDDQAPPTAAAVPALSARQQQAVGISVARPVRSAAPQPIRAYGLVLDPAALAADAGRLDSTAANARASSAQVGRLQGLYRNQAEASLKSLQAAQAQDYEAQAQAQAAAAAFAQQWGPLAKLPAAARRGTVAAVLSGRSLLLRADLPGRHSLGAMPREALLEVDGVKVPARVLGLLAHTAELQSLGLLLQVERAPPGLGPGARVPVMLQGAPRAGLLVPAGAVLYGEQGAYVYRQLADKDQDGRMHYAPAKVELLEPQGDGWLVQGVDEDDRIVVDGAGVLWSLQGLGTFSAEEQEHD